MTTLWPVAPGLRMKAPDKDTEETWPPPPMRPDATPALGKSMSVDTVMPVALPSEGGPSCTPDRVMVTRPAAIDCKATCTFKEYPIGYDCVMREGGAEVTLREPPLFVKKLGG